MRQRKFKAPPRKTLRRWRVPPALTHGDTDAFEGLSVLDEIPGELGMLLWQSLRDAMLWGRSNQADRGTLFAEGADRARIAALLTAGAPVEVEEPIKAVAAMLAGAETAREENVALACREVAQWAEARGLLATALAYSQAAAVVTPADAAASYTVGRLARRRAEHARAETWFRRTVALARQAGDWPTYALAFVGLGNLYMHRGNFPAARRFLVRALRAAGRNSLHDIEGMAQHDLFCIAGEAGNVDEANDWARRAFQAYGPLHPSVPRLANDVAFLWCIQGCFAPALPVLQSVLRHFTEPTHRVAVLGGIGRAAGGIGDRATFQQAWDDALELIGANGVQDMGARACLDLAHGALSLGAWERAEDAAQRALDGATRRGDAKTRLAADALMEAARRHQHAERTAGTGREAWRETAEALSTELVGSLEG
jgi:tetratricopeptide (TPR) repeat protein